MKKSWKFEISFGGKKCVQETKKPSHRPGGEIIMLFLEDWKKEKESVDRESSILKKCSERGASNEKFLSTRWGKG